MRLRVLAPLVLVSLFALSGCFRIHTLIELFPDGSGAITETVEFSSTFFEMVRGFSGDSTETPYYSEDDFFERADSLGEGVEYVWVEDLEDEEFQGYRVRYIFDDINTVRYSEAPDALSFSEDDEVVEEETEANDPIEGLGTALTFSYTDRRLDIGFPDEMREEAAEEIHPDTLALYTEQVREQISGQEGGMMRLLLSDARMSLDIAFPDGIAETNATFFADSTNSIVIADVRMGAIFDLMISDPELVARMQLAGSQPEQQALLAESAGDGIRFERNQDVFVILDD